MGKISAFRFESLQPLKKIVALSQACFSLSVNRTIVSGSFSKHVILLLLLLDFHQLSNSVQASEDGPTNEHVHTLSSRDILSSESR